MDPISLHAKAPTNYSFLHHQLIPSPSSRIRNSAHTTVAGGARRKANTNKPTQNGARIAVLSNHQIGKQQQQQLLLGTDRDRCSVRMDGASVVPRSQYQVLSHDYKG
uniref:Uncharacterized protein n=1 Tax=Oryza barthii TaxID=65489 RepID=A0A0D3G1I6_9ORYZ